MKKKKDPFAAQKSYVRLMRVVRDLGIDAHNASLNGLALHRERAKLLREWQGEKESLSASLQKVSADLGKAGELKSLTEVRAAVTAANGALNLLLATYRPVPAESQAWTVSQTWRRLSDLAKWAEERNRD
jgi:hypothetical protein